MFELLVQGTKPEERWRRRLPPEQTVLIGRDCGPWSVSWDSWLSRVHAELKAAGGLVQVRQLPNARNPIYFQGKEAVYFSLQPGQKFVIGQTSFLLQMEDEQSATLANLTLESRTISPGELKKISFRDAPQRLDMLGRLPDLIASAGSEASLSAQAGSLLLAGIPRADTVCLVAVEEPETEPALRVLHRESRRPGSEETLPSLRLVQEAVQRFRQTVFYVWRPNLPTDQHQFTLSDDCDWAFCTPIPGTSKHWGIYVSGRIPQDQGKMLLDSWDKTTLGDDLKFVELVASILGALCQLISQSAT